MPVSTCRLAHLSLSNSEMHVAMRPEGVPRLEALVKQSGTMVLFPGPGSIDVRDLVIPPPTLVVVDGSWINARKLVQRSPLLAALPRLGFTPSQPTNYRIRKEPAAHCLSTIEAVAYVLAQLEPDPIDWEPREGEEGRAERFSTILGSFTRMVDLQIEHIHEQGGRGSHRRHAARPSAVEGLRARADRLVLVFAEGGGEGSAARVHWVAMRHGSGERFEALFRPEWPLAPTTPRAFAAVDCTDESLDAARSRWAEFTRADDVPSSWGTHPFDVLGRQQIALPDPLDLRRLITNVLHAPLGGVEHLATGLGAALPHGQGRPARMLVALDAVVRALLTGELRVGG